MKNVRVGDKLVLRKDLEVGKQYGEVTFIASMPEYEGRVITEIYGYTIGSVYVNTGEDMGYYYTYEMLDLDYYKELREKKTVKDYKISMGGKLSTKSYTEKEAEMIYNLLKHDLKIDDVKFVYLGKS